MEDTTGRPVADTGTNGFLSDAPGAPALYQSYPSVDLYLRLLRLEPTTEQRGNCSLT